jgi:hypothetical protein
MQTTRRQFLPLALAAMATPLAARAFAAGKDNIIIEPVTPSSRDGTPYSRFANMGPLGYPEGPIHVTPSADLSLAVWAPPGVDEGRLVVFSHGELELPQDYDRLLRHWASHGFIVAAPLHDDSVVRSGLMARQQEADNERGGSWDPGAVFRDSKYWRARPRDCRGVLEAIPRIEQACRMRILDERPVIAGHGFGAFAAQLLLGVHATGSAGELYEADPRWYAGMLLSPQGRGVLGLGDGAWDNLARPILVATGNGDNDATGQDPNVKLEPFSLSPPGNRHLAWFGHINHTLWGGNQVRPGTAQELVFQDLLAVTTAFLDAYSNYNKETFGLLTGDYLTTASGGRMSAHYR